MFAISSSDELLKPTTYRVQAVCAIAESTQIVCHLDRVFFTIIQDNAAVQTGQC